MVKSHAMYFAGDFVDMVSERELEVLRWASIGKTNDEIAQIMSLTIFIVKKDLERAATKLGSMGRTHTVATALRKQIIQ